MNVIFALVICGTTFGMPVGYKTSSSPSFPETIWLGGLIPYKIDKRFEQLGKQHRISLLFFELLEEKIVK